MPAKKFRGAEPYSVHPGVAMVQKWVAELKSKTGRSLDELKPKARLQGGSKMLAVPKAANPCRNWRREAWRNVGM